MIKRKLSCELAHAQGKKYYHLIQQKICPYDDLFNGKIELCYILSYSSFFKVPYSTVVKSWNTVIKCPRFEFLYFFGEPISGKKLPINVLTLIW